MKRPPTGHVLTAIAAPDNLIIINMQFFAGCMTRVLVYRKGRLKAGCGHEWLPRNFCKQTPGQ